MLSDRHTNTHTQTKYCNPRCACAPRVNDTTLDSSLVAVLLYHSLAPTKKGGVTWVNYPMKTVLVDMMEGGDFSLDDYCDRFCQSWFPI